METKLITVPTARCRHSRFNTRKTRSEAEVDILAERIKRIGFEQTRAVWVVEAQDGAFEVFAGGTRLEAARKAGLETIPAVLHMGLTDDDISRLADQDNENDEYHVPVSPVDIWAEYARLRDEEGWTQERIAKAKGVSQALVAMRLRLHSLSERVKSFIRQKQIDEGHLIEITQGISHLIPAFSPWLTTEQAWEELAEKAVRDKGKNGSKSVRAVREDVAAWREFIEYAQAVYESLPESATLYDLSGSEPKPYPFSARHAFVEELARRNARSLVKVKESEHKIRRFVADNLESYKRFVEAKSAEAARLAEIGEKTQRILQKFPCGDCIKFLQRWEGPKIRLVLTDPPYGIAYVPSRRWRSKSPDPMQGDDPKLALELLKAAIESLIPHLSDHAHLLVFCGWRTEPDVRSVLESFGLTIKGSLVWVKEEHTVGDVRGAFAPRHERIVHAVKGSPEVTPRIADVLEVPRSRETSHPTEKPVELLRRLIESTTAEGDLVADPFAGCASTLIAAMRCNRDFWGAEIDERYHDEGARRLLRELHVSGG